MRAALYGRVSTADQDSEMQIQAMREYCERRKWDISVIAQETESGAKTKRPERAELLLLAKRNQVDVIVVWKLDRWSRSSVDLLTTLVELHACGVLFVSMTEGFDLSTPQGQAMAGMLAVFAQFERDMIAERVTAGIKRYRREGNAWGRPSKTCAMIETVRKLYESGKSYNEISAETNLGYTTVYRLLRDANLIDREKIYLLDCGGGLHKIGRSWQIEKRASQIEKKLERKVKLLRYWFVSTPRACEQELLRYFRLHQATETVTAQKKIYLGREYFNLPVEKVKWLMELEDLEAWTVSTKTLPSLWGKEKSL
jgi:putative DNA-invertase from lambdoid prophage Rac